MANELATLAYLRSIATKRSTKWKRRLADGSEASYSCKGGMDGDKRSSADLAEHLVRVNPVVKLSLKLDDDATEPIQTSGAKVAKFVHTDAALATEEAIRKAHDEARAAKDHAAALENGTAGIRPEVQAALEAAPARKGK